MRGPRRSGWFAILPIVSGLLFAAPALSADAATVGAPLTSAVSTSSDSWLMLPMGELSDPNNTFWQLLHAAPGSSQWSVVTPEGVADNGGLLVGTSGGPTVVGFVPSQLLRYSPLAQTSDGGATWSPQLLPAGLTARPDALAYGAGGALALIVGRKVLSAPPNLSRWSPLVTTPLLSHAFLSCGVTAIDAVAVLPSRSPLVATGCRNGVVGIFTKEGGAWKSYGTTPRGPSRSATDVLRLQAFDTTVAALAATTRGGRGALFAMWREGGAPWTEAAPLALPAKASVIASALGADGDLAVILRSPKAGVTAYSVEQDGSWVRLTRPPSGTTAVALPSGPRSDGGPTIDAFTVQGGSLTVYALSPLEPRWVRVQSSQITIPYGSSG